MRGTELHSRTEREVGHRTSRDFVELWNDDENSFDVDPPNAVLSFLAPDGTPPEDAVVIIKDPRLDGEDLTYSVDLKDGLLPAKADGCSLFIDSFGRPRSPVSAAGMHRRQRRRRR